MLVEALGFSSSFSKAEETRKDEMKKGNRQFQLQRMQSFIRAHDLNLADENLSVSKSNHGLVAVDGDSSGSVVNALVLIGIQEATDESNRWTPTSSTDNVLKNRAKSLNNGSKVNEDPMGRWKNAASGEKVLVWSSKCTRPGHGSDYPVVRSRGVIQASAREVVDLLKDSDKVTSYNKLSLGREDQHIITQNITSSVHSTEKCPHLGIPGEAKIMSSKSHPPLTRKPLEFKTLFYARQLDEGDGVEFENVAYITVGRSVWETKDGKTDGSDTSTTRCEILLSVNLLREVRGPNGEEWCELTNITHAVSPGIPIFIGKQVGLVAAENYIKDIRALFSK